MKVPVSWLSEYVDLSGLTIKDLCDKLTFSGVEVEGCDKIGFDRQENYVVAEVRACEPHPNADRLRLCKVFDGTDELQIVCGAPNVAVGQKVCLAKLGAVLPDGSKLKKAKIRGVESFGMLCAEDELGLSNRHEGLLVLDQALTPGLPLTEVLPRPDTVLDLEITWNRSDCLSIIGIAREFAALLDRPVKLPDVSFQEAGEPVDKLASVRVEDSALCPRYTARVLTKVQDGPAPEWMRRRLELCGVRPISLIVDVTNYVMLECGQPLHAFDYHRVADHTIVVRRARAGERMTTLDNMERTLDDQMLVIADPRAAVAVAGVMGGAGSEIAVGSTDEVLLESATFAAPSVKRTSTMLNLKTESARRFERTVDPGLADWASRRATALLVQCGGAVVAKGVIDADSRPSGARQVALRFQRCREVLGVMLGEDRMIQILSSLGLRMVERLSDQAIFAIPSWRVDLEIEADLIEEVARMHGLAAIPDQAPQTVAVADADDAGVRAVSLCRQTMLGLGFTEAMNYSFLSASELDAFDTRHVGRRLVLPNPVSADYAVMRDSLLPQLIGALGRNAARQVETVTLFEMGRVFWRAADGAPAEEERIAIGLCGPAGRGALERRRPVTNEEAALWLKGVVEALTSRLHAGTIALRPVSHPAMEPEWGTEILLHGEPIGILGLVNSALRHPYRMTSPLAVAEMRLHPLLAGVWRVAPAQSVPAFPGVRRDLAFVAPRSVQHGAIVAAIRQAGVADLTGVALFDIFESKEIGRDKRSLAYALEFRSPSRTLTDDEVNGSLQKIIQALKQALPVEMREG
ncbi:MAG: phenylalanine--tRNA ligase subunit beta [Magnetococcus sp. WYHC-3]